MASGLNPENNLQTLRVDEYGSLVVTWGPPPEMPWLTSAFGSLTATVNTSGVTVPDAGQTLTDNSAYRLVDGSVWDPTPSGYNHLITQGPDSLTFQRAGIYSIEVWATVASSTNNVYVAFKHGKNGVIALGRRPRTFLASSADKRSVSAFGTIQADAGDVVRLYVAASVACDVIIEDCVFRVTELLTGDLGP